LRQTRRHCAAGGVQHEAGAALGGDPGGARVEIIRHPPRQGAAGDDEIAFGLAEFVQQRLPFAFGDLRAFGDEAEFAAARPLQDRGAGAGVAGDHDPAAHQLVKIDQVVIGGPDRPAR
jgi:hypothetical protein